LVTQADPSSAKFISTIEVNRSQKSLSHHVVKNLHIAFRIIILYRVVKIVALNVIKQENIYHRNITVEVERQTAEDEGSTA
jgi:hypothetical protein